VSRVKICPTCNGTGVVSTPQATPVPHSNTTTSKAAAQHQRKTGKAKRDAERVLDALRVKPDTADGICVRLGLSHQTGSARVSGLKRGGHIQDSGRKARTRSGRLAIIWETK
jgi:hypothetical protein